MFCDWKTLVFELKLQRPFTMGCRDKRVFIGTRVNSSVCSYDNVLIISPPVENVITCIQKTRGVDQVLVQCWASVVDGGPALAQHLINSSCLLHGVQVPSVVLMLAQCRRRWAVIISTLCICILFTG